MGLSFSFWGRTEHLIAASRLVLASFSLLAIWFDPSEPSKYAALVYLLLTAYLTYALVIAVLVWASSGLLFRLPLVTHILDLIVFLLFMYLTEWPSSPFFAYFVFSLLCATVRWQWRGTIWTAAATLTAFLAIGLYAGEILQDPAFELNRFIIGAVYFAVAAALLGYLGAHEFQRRQQLSKLAAWPRTPPVEVEKVVSEVLERAGSILGASRVLMVWEEPEEPWLHLVMFSDGRLEWRREPPGSFSPLVDASLEGKSFFSHDVRASTAVVVDAASSHPRHWNGEALNQELQSLFNVRSVLSVGVSGENLDGRFFFLDKPGLSSDDLTIAEVVAGQAVTSMDLFYSLQRLQQAAVLRERVRVARDLHDGVLQSLSAVGLQLQAVLQVPRADPEEVREQLRRIQNLIVQEQRDLRSFVEELNIATLVPSQLDFKLGHVLEQLRETIEHQWSLSVNLKLDGSEAGVPVSLAREIYHIVREGLVNVARHAHASAASVEMEIQDRQVRINVSDNGHGFPFKGYYDQAALTATGMGPIMLKNRVASLKGTLGIHSTETGARLDITLPLPQPGA